jgi:parallel beta-helix repeat protein
MFWHHKLAFVAAAALAGGSAFAQGSTKTVEVNCPAGESISRALDSGNQTKRLIVVVRGICTESVSIERDDVTIRGHATDGGTILGPDPAVDTVVVAARGVTLEALTVSGGRNGITAVGGQLSVLGANVQRTGRNGITYASGSSGTIDNCTIQSNARDGISVDASSATIINSTISQNARTGVLVTVGSAARIGVDNRNGAAGNFIRQNGANGIVVSSGGYGLIAMNEITGNGVDPAQIGRQGISVIEARADLVGGNTISGHVSQGLFARASVLQLGGPALGFSTVNTFTGNGGPSNFGGIFAVLGSSLTVRDAVISGNSGPGLTFSLRSQGQTFNSTIQSNSSDGIRLVLGSALLPGTPLTTVSGNGGFGVQCTDPESSVLNTFPPFLSLAGNAAGEVSPGCTGF